MAAGSSCTLSVSFTPSAAPGTAESATLTILDAAPNSPQQVTLAGISVAPPKVAPSTLPFPKTKVGVVSTAQAVTITNNQSAAITITGITISGTNPGDFSKTTDCSTTLAGLKNCSVSVIFKPTAKDPRSATLMVDIIPDTASPHKVSLSGTGT